MTRTLTREVGAKIQKARKEAGFANAESLAAGLGVSTSTIERIEQGNGHLDLERLAQIAALTRKPLAHFLSEDGIEAEPAADLPQAQATGS